MTKSEDYCPSGSGVAGYIRTKVECVSVDGTGSVSKDLPSSLKALSQASGALLSPVGCVSSTRIIHSQEWESIKAYLGKEPAGQRLLLFADTKPTFVDLFDIWRFSHLSVAIWLGSFEECSLRSITQMLLVDETSAHDNWYVTVGRSESSQLGCSGHKIEDLFGVWKWAQIDPDTRRMISPKASTVMFFDHEWGDRDSLELSDGDLVHFLDGFSGRQREWVSMILVLFGRIEAACDLLGVKASELSRCMPVLLLWKGTSGRVESGASGINRDVVCGLVDRFETGIGKVVSSDVRIQGEHLASNGEVKFVNEFITSGFFSEWLQGDPSRASTLIRWINSEQPNREWGDIAGDGTRISLAHAMKGLGFDSQAQSLLSEQSFQDRVVARNARGELDRFYGCMSECELQDDALRLLSRSMPASAESDDGAREWRIRLVWSRFHPEWRYSTILSALDVEFRKQYESPDVERIRMACLVLTDRKEEVLSAWERRGMPEEDAMLAAVVCRNSGKFALSAEIMARVDEHKASIRCLKEKAISRVLVDDWESGQTIAAKAGLGVEELVIGRYVWWFRRPSDLSEPNHCAIKGLIPSDPRQWRDTRTAIAAISVDAFTGHLWDDATLLDEAILPPRCGLVPKLLEVLCFRALAVNEIKSFQRNADWERVLRCYDGGDHSRRDDICFAIACASLTGPVSRRHMNASLERIGSGEARYRRAVDNYDEMYLFSFLLRLTGCEDLGGQLADKLLGIAPIAAFYEPKIHSIGLKKVSADKSIILRLGKMAREMMWVIEESGFK